jgi:hypothetical protein
MQDVADEGLTHYRTDEEYQRRMEHAIQSPAQLWAFNVWVNRVRHHLTERTLQVCHQCDTATHVLCEHFVVPLRAEARAPALQEVPIPLPRLHTTGAELMTPLTWIMPRGEFDVARLGNDNFHPSQSLNTDDWVIDELRIYLTLKKEVSYENRDQCVIHLRKLGVAWLTTNHKLTSAAVNMLAVTVQKVADEVDTACLMNMRSPNSVFQRRWLGWVSASLVPICWGLKQIL